MGFLNKIPDVVGGAIVGAAGQLGGAALQSRAAGKATEAQSQATDKAMAFQREQAAKAEEAYKAQWDQWNASRQALLQRYGIDIAPPDLAGGASGAPSSGAVPRGTPPPGAAPGAPPARSLGEIAGGPPPMVGGAANRPTGVPRGDLGSWNDWSRMGLGGPRRA